MKKNTYVLNTLLAAAVGIYLLIDLLVRTLAPAVILPKASIPNLVLLSLIVLVIEHYAAPNASRCYICIPAFSLLTFGLLPWAAGYAGGMELVKLAVAGCTVFTAVTWLFGSITDRLSTGPKANLALVISALGLYLASQCFTGIFL